MREARDNTGRTPLFQAVGMETNIEKISFLLYRGASSIDVKDELGRTLVILACYGR